MERNKSYRRRDYLRIQDYSNRGTDKRNEHVYTYIKDTIQL